MRTVVTRLRRNTACDSARSAETLLRKASLPEKPSMAITMKVAPRALRVRAAAAASAVIGRPPA